MSADAAPSAYDQLTITVTLYQHQESNESQPKHPTWKSLGDMLTDPKYVEESPCTAAEGPQKCQGKKCFWKGHSSLPDNPMAWGPFEIEGKRLDKNVKFITVLVLDFDHVSVDEVKHITQRLKPYEHILHSTHNHRDTDICFRAVVLLSRKVEANVWHRFLASSVAFLDVPADPVCKNRSRFYYRPSHPRDIPFESQRNRGQALNVDEVLAWGVINAPETPPPAFDDDYERVLPEETEWDLESDEVQEAIALGVNNFPDNHRNETALAYAGMLRRYGAKKEDARYIIFEIFKQGGSDKPVQRAAAVDHTWGLSEDDAMTGFTRLSQFIGEDIAKEFGGLCNRARNNAFLKNFQETKKSAEAAAGNVVPLRPAVPVITDPGVLKRAAQDYAAMRLKNPERDQRIAGVLMRRLLKGEQLAYAGGVRAFHADGSPVADVETVREDETLGVKPEDALRSMVSALAFVLPLGTPYSAAWALMRESVSKMPPNAPGKDEWSVLGEKVWLDAVLERETRGAKRYNERKAEQEKRRAALLTDHSAASTRGTTDTVATVLPMPPPLPPGVPSIRNSDEPAAPTPVVPITAARSIVMPPPITAPPNGSEWQDLIEKKGDGTLAPTPHNAQLILRNHPDFLGYIRFNDVSKKVQILGGPLQRHSQLPFELLVAHLRDWLHVGHLYDINDNDLGKRLAMVAYENRYDPIKIHLQSLKWDGTPRIDTWLPTYCGATTRGYEPGSPESIRYLTKIGRRWLISLVARGLKPGCKVENVLTLEGPQGMGKSTIFKILGGEYFCDTPIILGDKDSRMLAAQYWLCELAEIVAFKRTGHDQLKNFFSSQLDVYRPPYGKGLEESPRRAVFVATTNDDKYLVDETGNRRYWAVQVNFVASALEALARDRDQLLAEAVVAYMAGEKWHFDYDEIGETEEESSARMMESPTAQFVQQWWYGMNPIERPKTFTAADVATKALELEPGRVTKETLQAIGQTLRKLGFIHRRETKGLRSYYWIPTMELLTAERVSKHSTAVAFMQPVKDDKKPAQ